MLKKKGEIFDWVDYKSSWYCLIQILQLLRKHDPDWKETWNIPALDGDNIYNRLITGEQYFNKVLTMIQVTEELKELELEDFQTLCPDFMNTIKQSRMTVRFKKMSLFLAQNQVDLKKMLDEGSQKNTSDSESLKKQLRDSLRDLHSGISKYVTVVRSRKRRERRQRASAPGGTTRFRRDVIPQNVIPQNPASASLHDIVVAKDVEFDVRTAAKVLSHAEEN